MDELAMLTEAELATLLNLHIQTVAKMRKDGEGPKFATLLNGKRKTYRYSRDDVQAWIEERTQAGAGE